MPIIPEDSPPVSDQEMEPSPYPPAWLPMRNHGNWPWWKKPTKKERAAASVAQERIVTWYCATCGRQELPDAPRGKKDCPVCGNKVRHRVSRYEWYLADALAAELAPRCSSFDVEEQYPIPAGRGLGEQFAWYFDLFVACCFNDGSYYEAAVEIDGPRHAKQVAYGSDWHTNDEHKENDYREWCASRDEGYGAVYRVTNFECGKYAAAGTARGIIDAMHRGAHGESG